MLLLLLDCFIVWITFTFLFPGELLWQEIPLNVTFVKSIFTPKPVSLGLDQDRSHEPGSQVLLQNTILSSRHDFNFTVDESLRGFLQTLM